MNISNSKEFTLSYCTNDIPDKVFTIKLQPSTTCQDFIDILSEKEKKIYKSVFYKGSEIDNQDLMLDYFEDDPNCVFIASTSSEAPILKIPDHNNISNDNENPNNCSQIPDNHQQPTNQNQRFR